MKTARPTFELGVTRYFGKGDIGSSGLKTGWAIPEEAHSWNDGVQAVMELSTEAAAEQYTIEFEGRPFVNELCPTQEIAMYCNGFLTGFWKLHEAKSYSLSAIIEPEQILSRDGGAFAKLIWVLPNSVKPADIKLNNDGRRLGFCFHALTIREAEDESLAPSL
jgi:hypothetical protein